MTAATLPVVYTSVEVILQMVPEIGSVSTATSAAIAQAAGMAEATMNAKLAARYAVPISVPVPALTAIATDLAVYRFLTRKPLVGDASKASPWFDRFKESSELLDQIADGAVALVGVDGAAVDLGAGAPSFHSSTMRYQPTFNEGEPECWVQDPQKAADDYGVPLSTAVGS